MKDIFEKYWKTAVFTAVGAGLGFTYWRIIGCSSGTCPITANWHTSTLMGGLLGMTIVPSKWKSNGKRSAVISEKHTDKNITVDQK